MSFPVLEHITKSVRHATFYLSCGGEDAPLIVFVHGWPELSISWRASAAGASPALGFRAIAPDMRGYGRSSVYARHEDYALEHSVRRHARAAGRAGSRRRRSGSATTGEAPWCGAWPAIIPSGASASPTSACPISRRVSPGAPSFRWSIAQFTREAQYPAGQWDYQLFYEESFDAARSGFEANVRDHRQGPVQRRGAPAGKGKPSRTASGPPQRRLVRRRRVTRPTCHGTRTC